MQWSSSGGEGLGPLAYEPNEFAASETFALPMRAVRSPHRLATPTAVIRRTLGTHQCRCGAWIRETSAPRGRQLNRRGRSVYGRPPVGCDRVWHTRSLGGIVLGFQSIAHVSSIYVVGEAQTIVENCGNTLILRCSASKQGGTAQDCVPPPRRMSQLPFLEYAASHRSRRASFGGRAAARPCRLPETCGNARFVGAKAKQCWGGKGIHVYYRKSSDFLHGRSVRSPARCRRWLSAGWCWPNQK
jgi:hypothetical protein